MILKARNNAEIITDGARRYTDDILVDLQRYLGEYIEIIEKNRRELSEAYAQEGEEPEAPQEEYPEAARKKRPWRSPKGARKETSPSEVALGLFIPPLLRQKQYKKQALPARPAGGDGRASSFWCTAWCRAGPGFCSRAGHGRFFFVRRPPKNKTRGDQNRAAEGQQPQRAPPGRRGGCKGQKACGSVGKQCGKQALYPFKEQVARGAHRSEHLGLRQNAEPPKDTKKEQPAARRARGSEELASAAQALVFSNRPKAMASANALGRPSAFKGSVSKYKKPHSLKAQSSARKKDDGAAHPQHGEHAADYGVEQRSAGAKGSGD